MRSRGSGLEDAAERSTDGARALAGGREPGELTVAHIVATFAVALAVVLVFVLLAGGP